MTIAATTAGSVSWDESLGAFRVTGFAEASQVLRGDGWSSDPRRSPLVAPDVQDLPEGNLLFTDPPDHTRLRRLVSPAFKLTSIRGLQPRVTAIVDAVLDGLGELDGEIDVVADHPDQRAHLLTNPDHAIEELLRMEGPVQLAARTATADHRLGDHHVQAGQAVLVDIRQANRDPARFLDPWRLDLSRPPSGHLTFGVGAHFCLGAGLARLEATETLTRLWHRYPDLELAGHHPPVWRPSLAFHALEALPIHLGRNSTIPVGKRDDRRSATASPE